MSRHRPDIPPMQGDVWKHYRHGDLYRIISLSRFHMGGEVAVTYESLQDGSRWTRGLTEFLEENNDNGRQFFTFVRVKP